MSLVARLLFGGVALLAASAVQAGPPYLTDDPVPTDPRHWEIYAFATGEGRGSDFDGDAGLDLNYGAVEGVQLTATLPYSSSHSLLQGWRSGAGDVELGIKYRVFHDERAGISAAIFPRVILPTASHSTGERAKFLLPLWVGEDFPGGASVFGGGGYMINPGVGNRDFWQAAVAVTHDMSKSTSLGIELTRQGADTVGGTSQIRAGASGIVHLSDHYAILLSAGPTWADRQTSYHFYGALGLNF